MIRQAVVLAAGLGTRIRTDAQALPKPLQCVAGIPLLTRTILILACAGVRRFYVVSGFKADALRATMGADPYLHATGITVEWIHNRDYHLANGVSMLAAAPYVKGPFLLSMADHVYDVGLAELAAGADLERSDLCLCVDRRIQDVYDIEDATKVRTSNGLIVEIGKDLANYDAIDCGVFAVGPALFEHLEAVYVQRGDCSLSDGVRAVAERGRATVLDIGHSFWQDVDTLGALARAEYVLMHHEVPAQSFAG